jgi:hypothetical protein
LVFRYVSWIRRIHQRAIWDSAPPDLVSLTAMDSDLTYSWWKQLIPYLIAIITMKAMVLMPLLLPHISTALLAFAQGALEYLNPSVQVVFAMAVFPIIMNVIQFCIVDQFIKAGRTDTVEDKEEEDTEYTRIATDEEEQRYKPSNIALRPMGSPVIRRNSSNVSSPRWSHDEDWSRISGRSE